MVAQNSNEPKKLTEDRLIVYLRDGRKIEQDWNPNNNSENLMNEVKNNWGRMVFLELWSGGKQTYMPKEAILSIEVEWR